MEQTRFMVRFKDGRVANDATDWVEPLDQLVRSEEVECGWLDLQSPYAVDLEELQELFGFNKHAIEDCRRFDQRAKLEVFEGHSFWVCHSAERDKLELKLTELHGFITSNWCVTVRQGAIAPLESLSQTWNARSFPTSSSEVWAVLLESVLEQNAKVVHSVSEELGRIDESIGQRAAMLRADSKIEELHHHKMAIKGLRRLVAPHVEYLRAIFEERLVLAAPADLNRYRAVKDQCQHLVEKMDLGLDEATSIRDSIAVASSLATARTMKRLTVFSAIFLPLTFVTGFFGMNFSAIPVHDPAWLWAVVAFCLLAPPATLVLLTLF